MFKTVLHTNKNSKKAAGTALALTAALVTANCTPKVAASSTSMKPCYSRPLPVQNSLRQINSPLSELNIDERGHVAGMPDVPLANRRERLLTSILKVGSPLWEGSGFIVGNLNRQYAVTAAHVVGKNSPHDLVFQTASGKKVRGKAGCYIAQIGNRLVAPDTLKPGNQYIDVAVVRLEKPVGTPLPIAPKPADHGEWQYACNYQDNRPAKNPAMIAVITGQTPGMATTSPDAYRVMSGLGPNKERLLPGSSGGLLTDGHQITGMSVALWEEPAAPADLLVTDGIEVTGQATEGIPGVREPDIYPGIAMPPSVIQKAFAAAATMPNAG
ncbi:MAG TPA: serine protease [Nevskiaceae bacterium]|nr:serine protease [Nevskiaceae bacterium]